MNVHQISLLLAVVALYVEVGFSFVSNHFKPDPLHRSVGIGVSRIGASGALFSTSQGDVPLDTKSIIAAYEEWRRKFRKGDFDIRRFHNFENNYRVLTAANIKARDKALADGKTPPQWLELNEFGDYARDEYKAMLEKGEMQPASTESISSSVSRTQVIVPPKVRTTSQGTQVITPAPPKQPEVSNRTQQAKKDFRGISRGKTVTESPSGASSVAALYGPPSSSIDTPPPAQSAIPSFGTQVVRQSVQPESVSGGAQVVGVTNLYGPPSAPFVSSPAPGASGTRAVQQAGGGIPRGTQVISKAPPGGIEGSVGTPISSRQPAPRGTQVITKAPASLPSMSGLYGPPPSLSVGDAYAPRSTQVIQRASGQVAPRGTQVVGQDTTSNTRAWAVDERGTYVIQSGVEVASGRGTQVIRGSTKPAGDVVEARDESGMIRQFSDKISRSIFSLFGGQKSDEDASRSVRGTVKIQGGQDGDEGKQTVLVDMAELQQKIPSIFSFFGGSKSEEEVAVVPVAAAAAASTTPQGRPTLVIDRTFVEYHDVEGLPELRRWWQGADGVVTGFIYNSKNFNDGTKLTSSKLQRASCKAGNILRSGGVDYLLK
jgi:hypothetical protein